MLGNSNNLIGKTLGTCTLQRLVGRGGMGAVYLAQQSRPRRTVAVKVLLPDLVLEERPRDEFLARFRREADAIAALDHVNIMPIYEYSEQGDTAYLVMPYVTGGTLREVLEKRGKIPLEKALTIIEQATAGLDSAHAKGIIHRDLKPGNMLFHADGRILLADFGLAKVLKDVTESESNGRFLTTTGTIVGTPEYLSPEQSTGNPVDKRTDVYSLGVVLFHMLAGRVPFQGASPVAVAIKHTLEAPPSLTRINPAIPANIEAVVMKAIAKAPDQRFASAGAFAHAFREAIETAKGLYTLSDHPLEQDTHGEHAASEYTTHDEITTGPTEVDLTPSIQELDAHETLPEPALPLPIAEQSPVVMPALPEAHVDTTNDDIHASETEENPRLPPAQQPLASLSTVVTHPKAAIIEPLRMPPTTGPEPHLQRVTWQPAVQVQARRNLPLKRPQKHAGCQSVSMMLIGSFLTLLIIVAGAVAYFHFSPLGGNNNGTSHTTTDGTSKNSGTGRTATATAAHHTISGSAPTASIAGAGNAIYWTATPGQGCDQQGGQWSNTQANVTCNPSKVVDSQQTANNITGTFLNKLSGGQQLPDDYIVQVQVDGSANAQGLFGIFFRNQTGSEGQGAYSFLIDPQNDQGAGYIYNNTGSGQMLTSVFPLEAKMGGTLTIDIVVQGNTFVFYINGQSQGNASSGGQYTNGGPGLAADQGANVTFKNFAIYSMS